MEKSEVFESDGSELREEQMLHVHVIAALVSAGLLFAVAYITIG